MIKLPTPKYVVFYNGMKEIDDIETMHLSDAYINHTGCMELEAMIININTGHNKELIKRELNNKYKLSQSEIEKYMK